MAAPQENQFWKLRSKHGRDKLFASPQLLWQACCEYFEWCEANPFIEVDFRGKGNTEVKIPKMRPFTLQGLTQYLGCNTGYFRTFKQQLPAGEQDFNTVITRVEETIYNQKYSGAAAGFLNANIIARDLGLTDKKDVLAKIDIEKMLNNLDEENLQKLAQIILAQQGG